MSIANGLAGLSLLTGTDAYSAFAAAAVDLPKVETKAQRKAHAAFTLPETTAPWKAAPTTQPLSQRVSDITAMKSVIDKASGTDKSLPSDVLTTFTTYKALDRLQALAETAAKDTTSSADRLKLQKTFAKGLADLKTYLGNTAGSQINLAYTQAAREVRTVSVTAPSSQTTPTIVGTGVRDTRAGALAGVTGNERLSITLQDTIGAPDVLTIDLSTAAQPPTLDSVSDAINTAIKGVLQRDSAGNPVLDKNGNTIPKWAVSVEPTKTGDKWGLSIKRAGFETISIDQIDAPDAVFVAAGMTGTDTTSPVPTATRLTRFDSPDGTPERSTLGTITATDGIATARSKLAADADTTGKTKALTIAAAVSSDAIATDAQGFSYVVGTTAGDTKGNLSNGVNDLLLTKVDSEGAVVWQRNLGAAGAAKGAAVTIAPDGGIIVAGSVTGQFDGANSDGDIVVSRYDAKGNESFSTLIRSVGVESASALAVGADGQIYVGGRTDRNGGGSTIARLDTKGVLQENRVIAGADAGGIRALAVDGDGKLLALTSQSGNATLRKLDAGALSTQVASIDLGRADARALALGTDGTIAVVGATETALSGTQVNGINGGTDAFVARIDSGLSGAKVTYLGTGAADQADSVSFMGDNLYVGGRTTGALGGTRTGDVDGFVARIDADSGAVSRIDQFGTSTMKTEPVRVSAIAGGNTVLGALGLHRGTLSPSDSVTLEAQTGIRAGDEFSIKVGAGGAVRKITIAENETMSSLQMKLQKMLGTNANVSVPTVGTGRALSIAAKPGVQIQLIAGADGRDALEKLGLDAKRIAAPPTPVKNAPAVTPGGSFGLDLEDALQLDTKTNAAVALARIKQAVSFTQSAYRSLYWDDTKAALADPPRSGKTGGSTAIEQAQLANYQAALTRLTPVTTTTTATTSFSFL